MVPDETALLTGEQIQRRNDELAAEIVADLRGEPVVVIGLLRGCFVFCADLVRAISRAGGRVAEVDFLVASSYGSGTVSSGNVKIERDVRSDIAGRNVLLVDDILDTGNTLQRVLELLHTRGPGWLRTAVLLDKPSRRQVPVEADYTGFSIEDLFVIGYGLDYDQFYRELPYITTMVDRG
jgi:hypoxanthine phosphoribosyltransferase